MQVKQSTFAENSGSTGTMWSDFGSAVVYNSTFHSNVGANEGGVFSVSGNLVGF